EKLTSIDCGWFVHGLLPEARLTDGRRTCLRYAPRDDPNTQASRARLVRSVALLPSALRTVSHMRLQDRRRRQPRGSTSRSETSPLSTTRCLGPPLVAPAG